MDNILVAKWISLPVDNNSNNVSFIIYNLKINNQIIDDFFKIPKDLFGLLVFTLKEDGHAKSQGMWRFDIIVAIDGQPVNSLLDVREILMPDYKPGQTVDLLYIREGHFRRTDYVLSEIEFDFLAYYDESANERPEMPGLPEEKEEQEDEDIEVEPEEDEESAFEEKDDK